MTSNFTGDREKSWKGRGTPSCTTRRQNPSDPLREQVSRRERAPRTL